MCMQLHACQGYQVFLLSDFGTVPTVSFFFFFFSRLVLFLPPPPFPPSFYSKKIIFCRALPYTDRTYAFVKVYEENSIRFDDSRYCLWLCYIPETTMCLLSTDTNVFWEDRKVICWHICHWLSNSRYWYLANLI